MNSILTAALNGAILGALMAAVVWVGLRVAPRRALNAAARYLVWWAALAAAVMLPLAYLRAPSPSRMGGMLARNTAAGGQVARQVHGRAAPQVHDRAVDAARPSDATAPPSGLSFPLVVRAGAGSQWILTAWAAISAMMLARLTVGCILLERRKARAIAAPPRLAARIEAWLSGRGGARRHARLACSAEILSPMLAGLRRPAILIPERLIAELRDAELFQIGLHEAAHLVRRDDYALLVQRIVEALFAFHPVVWWITRQIDLEREIACDDVVVETMGLPRSYAECLTRMAELCNMELCNGASWGGTPAAGARSHLARRVDRLLDRNRQAGTRPGKMRLAAAIGMVAALACIAARTPGVVALAMPAVEAAGPATFGPATPGPAASLAEDPRPPADATASAASEPSETAAAPAPPRQAAAPVSPPSVVVPVTVQDPLNRYVTGLGKENFKVFEDGLEQEISAFSSENLPISAGIVVDTSGSMRDKLDQSRLVVAQFLNAASPQDEFFLVEFNVSAALVAGFTSDAGQIQNQLNLLQARGGTSLREAIYRAVAEMKNARNPSRVLLVVSDGEDNSSSLSQEDVRNAALTANVQIYAITFAAPVASAGRGPAFLREIAEQSGGRQFMADGQAALPGVAASVAVRNVYLLGYQSANPARDGKYRRLRVEAAPPKGLPPLKLSFRAGYYAPSQ
jgi:VWFA-related protein